LQRADEGWWQWVSGGVEDGESPAEAALRESKEEIGLEGTLFSLDTRASVPKIAFDVPPGWPDSLYLVEEHAFAIEVGTTSITLSPEHTAFDWLNYDSAFQRLRWQSNQTALWELNERIGGNNLTELSIGEYRA
jgi:dihydroneopterin triphosphate diphosphatase